MTDVIDRFTAMSATEVNEFFRTSDVLEITEVIRSAADEELRRLIDLDHFRAEGVVRDPRPVRRVRRRASGWRRSTGVVRFELARSKKDVELPHRPVRSGGKVTLDAGGRRPT